MIVVITGPTGVGKTKLSIMLAKKYNGIVINADATQIYEYLNIGSAKIKEEEKEGIEHFLFDIRKPNENYSVCDYQKDLRLLLDKYKNRNIFIVGGTGLYLKSALYNYEFSNINEKDYDEFSNEELYAMIKEIDKDSDIHQNNRVRLINFLNRGKTNNNGDKLLYPDTIFIGLTTDRETLYAKINKRVEEMFENGLVDEVKTLYKKYGSVNILKRAIGYKEVIMYLNNLISKDECIELIQKNSRHYAKRQYTWFNNKMDIKWFETDFENFNNTYEQIVDYIKKYD